MTSKYTLLDAKDESENLNQLHTNADECEEFDHDENKERGNWSGKYEFLLTAVGYAVGLGNVWRFPYLCYRNGGGAFLIPYLLVLFTIGLPLFVLINALGQYTSQGYLTCWEFSPIFRGIGITMIAKTFIGTGSYGMIIAWSMYYTAVSFPGFWRGNLPWESCDNSWNTENCWLKWPKLDCNGTGLIKEANGTCFNQTTRIGIWDRTVFKKHTNITIVLPSEEYYYNRVLGTTKGISDFGTLKWDVSLTYLAEVIVIYLCVFRGIKSSGKVVYFTATFPYLMIIVLLIKGLTLPNALEGVYYYLVPNIDRLKDPQIWYEASNQIVYSLGLTGGGQITCASYNRFRHNFLRDSIIICFANSFTSILAGFAVFSFLGYTAGEMGVGIEEVAKSGAGLAFVVYPSAVSTLPLAPMWSIFFFLMLFSLGVDSQFVFVEAFETSIADIFPQYLRNKQRRLIFHTCYMAFVFFAGLLFCAGSGIYWVQLMDIYMSWPGLLIGVIVTISLGWVYGPNNILRDMRIMLGDRFLIRGPISYYWKICWIMTPVIFVVILLFQWIKFSPLKYGTYEFPLWAIIFGWTAPLVAIMFMPIFAVKEVLKQNGNLFQRIRSASDPSADWGPVLPEHKKLVADEQSKYKTGIDNPVTVLSYTKEDETFM